jgi:hypothetical protein
MVRYLVQRDMNRGLHLRAGGHVPAYLDRVRVACEAAGMDVDGESGQRTYHVLAYLASKHWHGDDTYTAVEIAKSLGLPIDDGRIGSSRQIIGREIRKLAKLHLIEQTQIGNPKRGIPCSRCRLLFAIRDPAPDVWPEVEVDDLTAGFEAAIRDG